jgi:hypothetical protein
MDRIAEEIALAHRKNKGINNYTNGDFSAIM